VIFFKLRLGICLVILGEAYIKLCGFSIKGAVGKLVLAPRLTFGKTTGSLTKMATKS
jgi:hypothetical protein